MALGALRALDELQRPVPEDIAVVGFDGIADSAYFTPPLTTVKQDFTQIGEQAVIQAMALKDREPQETAGVEHTRIPVELIVRKSSERRPEVRYQKQEIQTLLKKVASLLP